MVKSSSQASSVHKYNHKYDLKVHKTHNVTTSTYNSTTSTREHSISTNSPQSTTQPLKCVATEARVQRGHSHMIVYLNINFNLHLSIFFLRANFFHDCILQLLYAWAHKNVYPPYISMYVWMYVCSKNACAAMYACWFCEIQI